MATSDLGRSTRVTRTVAAPPDAVFAAFLDPVSVQAWLPPEGMRATVHLFEPRPAGRIRMTLNYDDPTRGPGGKTTADSDTFEARVVEMRPGERVVWVSRFVSDDPSMAGEMRIVFDLRAAAQGTEVTCLCEGVPVGVRLADNEAGTRSTLANLARFVQGTAI